MASALRPIRTMVAKQEAMLATDPTNKKWLGYSSMRTDLASSSGIGARSSRFILLSVSR